jgi:hypothetical protein
MEAKMSCNHRLFLARAIILFPLLGSWQSRSAIAQDWAIEPQFDDARNFHNGAAPVMNGGYWGLIDKDGNWIVRPIFNAVTTAGMGRFGVKVKDRWGYVDARGNMVIEPRFENVQPFEDGVAAVKLGGVWGYIVPSGIFETEPRYLELGGREGNVFTARDSEGWALFRAGGDADSERSPASEWESEAEEDLPDAVRLFGISDGAAVAVFPDGERLVSVLDVETVGFIQATVSARFFSIRQMNEGYAAAAKEEGQWGYLSEDGIFFWGGKFEDAGTFSEGFAPVRHNGKWGYIGKTGEFAMEPKFDRAYPFRDGYAVVRAGEMRGFVTSGEAGVETFIPPRFEDAYRFSEGLAPVKNRFGRWGYIAAPPKLSERGIINLLPHE